MKHTKISVAGLTFDIAHTFDLLEKNAKDFLTDAKECDFKLEIDRCDIEAEREKAEKERQIEKLPPTEHTDDFLENSAAHRKIAQILPNYRAIVFHGSAVALGNEAVIFAAESGTGKTTHTNLWLKNIPESFVVNGDKPIIRIMDGVPMACGTPWSGKERLGTNAIVPLRAVCLLSRGENNKIEKISFGNAAPKLIGQTYRSGTADGIAKTLNTLKSIGEKIDFYHLYCNMEDEAATIAYRGIFHDEF